MRRWLEALGEACRQRRRAVLALASLAWLACLGLTAHYWGRVASPVEWLPPGPERHAFEIARREFGLGDDLMVVVGGPDSQARERFMLQLTGELARRPDLFTDLLYQVELAPFRRVLLYYLNVAQLVGLEEALGSVRPLLTPNQSLASWVVLLQGRQTSQLSAGLGEHYVRQLEKCLKSHGRAQLSSPLGKLVEPEQAEMLQLFWEGRESIFLPIDQGRRLVLFARPGVDPTASLQFLRRCAADIGPRNPDVQFELTGSYAIAEEQAASLQASLGQAVFSALSLVLVAIWFNVVPPGRLLAGIVAWGMGLGWTAGLGALRLEETGPLWVAALSLVAIVAGFLTLQTLWLAHQRLTVRVSLAGALALVALSFAGPALAGLGQMAAIGLLATLVAQLTVLPALVNPAPESAWVSPPLLPTVQRAGAVLITTALVAVGCLLWLSSLPFEADPWALVDRGAPSLQMEMQLSGTQTSSLYALMLAPDLQRARELSQRLKGLPVVDNVFCIADFLPPEPQLKRPLVESICKLSQGLGVPRPIPLGTARDMLALRTHMGEGDGSALLGDVDLDRMGPGEIQDALRAFQDGILADLRRLIALLEAQSPEPLRVEDLPASVRERTVGSSGRICLMVFPRFPYGQAGFLEGSVYENFVAQLQRVNPEVSGPAVFVAIAGSLSRQAHYWALGLAWVGLMVGLVIQLRSPLQAGLVLLGPTLAWLLTATLLFARGITPNLINWPVPVIHLILGTALSLDSLRRPRLSARVLGPAVAVLVAAGALGISRHPALAGLGFSLAVSLASNVLVSFTVVPALRRCLQAVGRR